MTTGLFIGRFQPLHRGHASAIEKALAEVETLIVGVGSAEKHHTRDNPFTCEERKQMIKTSVSGNYKIVSVPDTDNYAQWVSHVEVMAGKFDVIYGGNAVVNELFQKKGYEIRPVIETLYISASAIREMMARGDKDWKKFVPASAANLIEKLDGVERIRKLYKHHLNPVPAVDLVINYNGQIILIKRRDGKIALPGGFQEYGETSGQAGIREAKEETGLNIELDNLVGLYTDPKRDSRMHVISITYSAHAIGGELKSGDDATDAFAVPLDEALKLDLAFDHKKILGDYAIQMQAREKLAELEHEQWAHWTAHMLANMSQENTERWKRQASTAYKDLSESEKDSDRKWADKALSTINAKK